MKKIYSAPEVELRKFDVEDIITTSSTENINTAAMEATERTDMVTKLNSSTENKVTAVDVSGSNKTNWNEW